MFQQRLDSENEEAKKLQEEKSTLAAGIDKRKQDVEARLREVEAALANSEMTRKQLEVRTSH